MSQLSAKRLNRCALSYSQQHLRSRMTESRWSFPDSHGEECRFFGKDLSVPFGMVLKNAAVDFPAIAMDYDVLCGTPRIAGTRVPVYMVVDAVQYYGNLDGALKSYPHLTIEQVRDALSFAGAVLEQPVEYEP